ncbi:MAG: hypothetical protein SV765_09910 [Pseudomonadota bacterium]|nr:hypothetical protein [Pseudomonadota bacterium]
MEKLLRAGINIATSASFMCSALCFFEVSMKPQLKEKSEMDDVWFDDLVDAIGQFQCENYFSDHIGMRQQEQKAVVNRFQNDLVSKLNECNLGVNWRQEYMPSRGQRDSIDIYADGGDFAVAIELDKNRADQVAKKFVSRFALMPSKKVYFISLCYPGTDRMNINECVKYFQYCANLAKRMGGVYAGFIVQ